MSAAEAFLPRQCANMAQLDHDDLSGFSADEWIAQAVTGVTACTYGKAGRPDQLRRLAQGRTMATAGAPAVNAVTI